MNVFLERFRKFLEILCAILLIAITAVVFAQVVNRFVFHGTFAWAEEISIYMMVWLVFLGASINVLEESNIRIDFFVKLLPLRMQEFLEIICQLACAAALASNSPREGVLFSTPSIIFSFCSVESSAVRSGFSRKNSGTCWKPTLSQ